MWTHDVGGGFVKPEEIVGEEKCTPTDAEEGHDDHSEEKINASDPENGSPERKDGDVAEVRWVLFSGGGKGLIVSFLPYLYITKVFQSKLACSRYMPQSSKYWSLALLLELNGREQSRTPRR